MSWSIFKNKKDRSFKTFLTEIKNGKRNILELLGTFENLFHDAPFDLLMRNTDDVVSGVNRVQIGYGSYFNFFTNSLIKHHDNGDIKYILYATTRNAVFVKSTFNDVIEVLGNGFFDDRIFSFFNDGNIDALAGGRFKGLDLGHLWLLDDVTFVLQYKPIPMQEFSLIITLRPPKIIDTSIRRKGTILDLFDFDVDGLLRGRELRLYEENDEQGELRFKDYVFDLRSQKLPSFDRICIRIFGNERCFDKNVQTHVTIYSSGQIPSDISIGIAERLVKIYGQTNSGDADLAFHEREIIESGKFWVGREWRLNRQHGLQGENEPFSYYVTINNWEDEEGFKIHISLFNELVALFGVEE